MDGKLRIKEQNLNLAAAYIKMNDKGREILDMVIQKLVEIRWTTQKTTSYTTKLRRANNENSN